MIEKQCSKCLKVKNLGQFSKGKGKGGKDYWCKDCHSKYKRLKKKEKCSVCEEIKKVDKRINGKPLCSNCNSYNNLEKCDVCKNINRISKRVDGKVICKSCNRGEGLCSKCGYLSRIETKNPILCAKCYKKENNETCSKCNKIKIVNKRYNGNPLCYKCSFIKQECNICNNIREVYSRENGKPICYYCSRNKRMLTDNGYAVKVRVSSRIRPIIRNLGVSEHKNIKYGKIVDHLGDCPGKIEDYHIDHIFPLVAFNLEKEEECLVAFAPENHQWLTIDENLNKGAKYNEKELELFKKEIIKKYGGKYV